MIGKLTTDAGCRALAGLALLLCLGACGGSETASAPAAPTEGEQAALMDARSMLDARPAPEPTLAPDDGNE